MRLGNGKTESNRPKVAVPQQPKVKTVGLGFHVTAEDEEDFKEASRPSKKWVVEARNLNAGTTYRFRPLLPGVRKRYKIWIDKQHIDGKNAHSIWCKPSDLEPIMALELPSGLRIAQTVDNPAEYWRMPVAMWLDEDIVDPVIFVFSWTVYEAVWSIFEPKKFGTPAPGQKGKDISLRSYEEQGQDFWVAPYEGGRGNKYKAGVYGVEDSLEMSEKMVEKCAASIATLETKWDSWIETYDDVATWVESLGSSGPRATRRQYADGGAVETDADEEDFDPYRGE